MKSRHLEMEWVDLGAMAMNGYYAFPTLQYSWNLAIRLFRVIARHSLEESCPSAEMQSVYSAAPVYWARKKVKVETEKFNKVLQNIQIDNITELNEFIYAGLIW